MLPNAKLQVGLRRCACRWTIVDVAFRSVPTRVVPRAGQRKISETSRYLHVSGSFRFSGTPRDSWDIAVTVDKQKGYAVMMGGGFVNPMFCARCKVGANGFKIGVSFASGRPYALWKSEQVGGDRSGA